jgi:hypothetical protein
MSIYAFTIVIQIAAVLAAALAAAFWFMSSLVQIPARNLAIAALGGTRSDDLIQVGDALRKQGRLNAIAAICAAFSAIFQGVIVFLPTCATQT